MTGGTFNRAVGKDRPGTYVNTESTRVNRVGAAERGTVLIPLPAHDYGPANEFITIDSSAPDAQIDKLGYSVFDNHPSMLMIREAFKQASRVIVYIPRQGKRASAALEDALMARARYGGTRGNSLSVSIISNPVRGFDVTIYLDAVEVAVYEQLETANDLVKQTNTWIEFFEVEDYDHVSNLSAPLIPLAGVTLSGGSDGVLVVSDIITFLDKSEEISWNCLAFPFEASDEPDDPVPALQAAVIAKIRYFREDVGRYRKAVLANNNNANFEGIINVTNSVVLQGGQRVSLAEVTAWVAGADAGASNIQSNTHSVYAGAVEIIGAKNHIAAVQAIRNGEFFFSRSEAGEIKVEYDINSLTSFVFPKDESWRKNQVLRVLDTFAESLMLNFPPNRFKNRPSDWDVMEGLGRAELTLFYNAGAIKDVNADDFLVDREASVDDRTYFNVGLSPVGSAEKLFFTVRTR